MRTNGTKEETKAATKVAASVNAAKPKVSKSDTAEAEAGSPPTPASTAPGKAKAEADSPPTPASAAPGPGRSPASKHPRNDPNSNAAPEKPKCCVCDDPEQKGKPLLLCDECDKHYHCACLSPPLERRPKKGTWQCPSCANEPSALLASLLGIPEKDAYFTDNIDGCLRFMASDEFKVCSNSILDNGRPTCESVSLRAQKAWTEACTGVAALLAQTTRNTAADGRFVALTLLLPQLLKQRPGTRGGGDPSSWSQSQATLKLCQSFKRGNLPSIMRKAAREGEKLLAKRRQRPPPAPPVIPTPPPPPAPGPNPVPLWNVNTTLWSDMDQRVSRAEAAARASNLSRARKILTSAGLAAYDAAVELHDKHPVHALPTVAHHDPNFWTPPLPPEHPDATNSLTPLALAKALRKSPRGGAADQLGWRAHEDIGPLFSDSESDLAKTFCDRIAFCFFSGHFPPDTLDVPTLWGGNLIALSKAPKPGVRPILIGQAWRRLVARAVTPGLRAPCEEYFTGAHPRVFQFAAGVKDGASHAVNLTRTFLDAGKVTAGDPLNPIAAAVSDITNGFNEIARQPILDSIAGIASIAYDGNRILPGEALPYSCTPLAEIAPFVAGAYLNRATARYSAPNDVHFIGVTAGVQQGDVFGSTLFCAGLHPLLCRLMDRHPEVTCIAYADNVTFIGKLSLAWAALDEFNKLAREDLKLRINTSESLIHVPSWRTLDEPPALYNEVSARFPNTPLDCRETLQGFKFLGAPLGIDSFVTSSLDAAVANITSELPFLGELTDGLLHYRLLRFCVAPRMDYLLRTTNPILATTAACALDSALISHLSDFALLAPGAFHISNPESAHDWVKYRLHLDPDEGGFGFPHAPATSLAQFYLSSARFLQWVRGRDDLAFLHAYHAGEATWHTDLPYGVSGTLKHDIDRIDEILREMHTPVKADPNLRYPPPDPNPILIPTIHKLCSLPGEYEVPADSAPAGDDALVEILPKPHIFYSWVLSRLGWCHDAKITLPPELAAGINHLAKRSFPLNDPKGTSPFTSATAHSSQQIHYSPMQALNIISSSHVNFPRFAWAHFMALNLATSPPVAASLLSAGEKCKCGKSPDVNGHHLWNCKSRGSYYMGHEPLVEFFREVGANAGLRVAVKPKDGLSVDPNSNRKPDLSFKDHLPNSDGCSPLPTPLDADVAMVHPIPSNSLMINPRLMESRYREKIKHHQPWALAAGLKFTPLVFSSLGQADNDALRLLYLLDRRTQQTSCDIPSRPILASSDLAPSNISFSRLKARLTVAAWVAGAARGSGRASTFLGSLRSFTSPRVAVRDPAFLSPVFLRVRTNPCET